MITGSKDHDINVRTVGAAKQNKLVNMCKTHQFEHMFCFRNWIIYFQLHSFIRRPDENLIGFRLVVKVL